MKTDREREVCQALLRRRESDRADARPRPQHRRHRDRRRRQGHEVHRPAGRADPHDVRAVPAGSVGCGICAASAHCRRSDVARAGAPSESRGSSIRARRSSISAPPKRTSDDRCCANGWSRPSPRSSAVWRCCSPRSASTACSLYGVAQRTREFGIRIAIGAGAGSIVRLVMREAGWVVGGGIAVGVAASWALGRRRDHPLV